MNTKEKLADIFASKGFFIEECDYDMELQMDSIQFVVLLVDIEAQFNISIDGRYYSGEKLKSFNDFLSMIEDRLRK